MNYEKDIRIDESALDVEWLGQASLMLKYSRILAMSRKRADHAKINADVIKAELDKKIRAVPENYDLSKITEVAISNIILTSEEYKEAQTEIIEALYEVNMAQSAVRAIEQRKDALENLVKLYGQQYFAGPKIPRDISKEWEAREKQNQSNTQVGTALRRRRHDSFS